MIFGVRTYLIALVEIIEEYIYNHELRFHASITFSMSQGNPERQVSPTVFKPQA